METLSSKCKPTLPNWNANGRKKKRTPIVKKCLQLAKHGMIYTVVVKPSPNRGLFLIQSAVLFCAGVEAFLVHSIQPDPAVLNESWVRRNELLFLQTQSAEWATVSHCKLDTISCPTRAETCWMRQLHADKSGTDINSICTKRIPTSTPTPQAAAMGDNLGDGISRWTGTLQIIKRDLWVCCLMFETGGPAKSRQFI